MVVVKEFVLSSKTEISEFVNLTLYCSLTSKTAQCCSVVAVVVVR